MLAHMNTGDFIEVMRLTGAPPGGDHDTKFAAITTGVAAERDRVLTHLGKARASLMSLSHLIDNHSLNLIDHAMFGLQQAVADGFPAHELAQPKDDTLSELDKDAA